MASNMRKRGNSYQFRIMINGVEHNDSWKIPDGLTSKQAEKLAHKEYEKFEERARKGIITENITFEELSRMYIEDCRKNNLLKPKSIGNHERNLAHINKTLGHINLKDLHAPQINAFIKKLSEEPFYNPSDKEKKNPKYRSPETVKTYFRSLSCSLTWGVQNYYLEENPCLGKKIGLPRTVDKKEKGISEETARAYFDALASAPLKYQAFFLICVLTGCRRAEALGLKWSDFNEAEKTLHFEDSSQTIDGIKGIVINDSLKSESSVRTVALPDSAVKVLLQLKAEQAQERLEAGILWKHDPSNTSRAYCENHWKCESDTSGYCSRFCPMFKSEDRIFVTASGCPLDPNAPYKYFRKFAKENDLPEISIHDLRHFTASLLIAQGNPVTSVAWQLGHSDPSVTTRIYSHALKKAEQARTMANEVESFLIAK